MSAQQSDTTPTASLASLTDSGVGNIQHKPDAPCEQSTMQEIDDCLGIIVSRYLSAYLIEHKDHLPVGKLYALVMGEVEKSLLKETLAMTDGNQRKASAILGINRNTLRKKITDEG